MKIFLIILLIVLVLGVAPSMVGSYVIFSVLLKRTKPEKWGHSCSQPDDPEIVTIFGEGERWRAQYEKERVSAYIQNDGLKLYGEYFDFGYDRAVIISSGRMECCIYSTYFAEPYRQAGYNILVIDGRAHGLSEGKYNCIGHKECRDLLVWGKWLHDEKKNNSIILHGVCIGACASLLAITDDSCPDYFKGIVVEGMFKSFYESTKRHMQCDNRPIFPFLYGIMFYVRVLIGVNVVTDGPYKRIGKLKKPILFLHGRKDTFSLPVEAEKLYASCSAPKKLVWFEKGKHSRLRINNTEEYDQAIKTFLSEQSL